MSTVQSHAPGTFSWADLATTDTNAAKTFYTDLFGWASTDSPMGDDQFYTMFDKGGQNTAALYEMTKEQLESGAPPFWSVYLTVDSVDESAKKAASLGGKVLSDPFDVFDSGRMAVIQDPTGATFALWQPKNHIGAGVVAEAGAICWCELVTHDSETVKQFYSGLFGWEAQIVKTEPTSYTNFMNGGVPAAGMLQMTEEWKDFPTHWTVYFQVDNCDASAEKAASNGGNLKVPPSEISGVGRFALIQDPQGATFSIIQPPN